MAKNKLQKMNLVNKRQTQYSFLNEHYKHKYSSGGSLRSKKLGRSQRSLSCKEPLHLVFKVNQSRLRHKTLRSFQGFKLIDKIIKKYSAKFYVQVEQITIQNDHLHLLIRTKRRSQFHSFFRVVAGQIAQIFNKQGLLLSQRMTDTPNIQINGTQLWKYRPFTRVIRGYKAYKLVRNYIQLNEKEITGEIKYRGSRLKGVLDCEWKILWS